MVYFKYFIKLLKQNLLKLFFVFLFLLLSTACFLCIFCSSNHVQGYTLTTNQQLLLDYYENNLKSTYDSLIITADNYLIVWNQPSGQNRFWLVDTTNWLQCEKENDINTVCYYCNDGVNVTYWTDAIKFGTGQYHYQINNGVNGFVVSSVDIYYGLYHASNFANIIFSANYFNLRPASIVNTTTQAYQDNLVDGSFEYLIVSAGDYAQYPVVFHINNGQDSIDSPNKYKYIVLDHDSPYADISVEPNQYQTWTIPKADLIPFYNNYTYNMWLTYGQNSALSTSLYTWTTNFSQSTIDNAVVDEQDATRQVAENTHEIVNEINDLNNFISDTSFDDTLVDLPTLEINENISSYIDQLFQSICDAFTSEDAIDFVFTIPNSNGATITIPSDYIESHLPNSIIVLIRAFYVYFISRFIIKDIMHTINRLKQGDYFTGSDVEIKTEVL